MAWLTRWLKNVLKFCSQITGNGIRCIESKGENFPLPSLSKFAKPLHIYTLYHFSASQVNMSDRNFWLNTKKQEIRDFSILPRLHFITAFRFWGQTAIAGTAQLTSPLLESCFMPGNPSTELSASPRVDSTAWILRAALSSLPFLPLAGDKELPEYI